MTVTYSADVSTVQLTTFGKLMFRWRGSIWKAIYKELALWMIAYACLSMLYYVLLSDAYKRVFEDMRHLFAKYTDVIPITFMLGFFINVVVNRFWLLLRNIGWIDASALYLCNYISGQDDHARLLRRNIIRYLLCHQILVYRDISEVIRRRFPTLETLVVAGKLRNCYITEMELLQFNAVESKNRKYWVPINWAMGVARRARKERRVDSPQALQEIFNKINDFRSDLAQLIVHDWVPIPLAYSQVMSFIVRLYFFLALMGHQNIAPSPDSTYVDTINMHIPFVSMCQFIFYMGWMKVAEVLMNPFGDDDDDLEINWLIDRNLQVGMTIADETWEPPLIKDQNWMMKMAEPMYSIDAVKGRYNPQIGSVSNINRRRTSTQMVMKEMKDENLDSDFSSTEFGGGRHLNSFFLRASTLSNAVNGIRDALKRRLSRLTSRVESITDAESPAWDESNDATGNILNSFRRLEEYSSNPQRERRELHVLPEEEESHKSCQLRCCILRHSVIRENESESSEEESRKVQRKGRKLRKKISKLDDSKNEIANNSLNPCRTSHEGDDEHESGVEDELSTAAVRRPRIENMQRPLKSSETDKNLS
ncbi:unnamed protein product [Thelazia callipaeda]|uniref:Bestrophin homolog n=1 Tax=Thelazia callipaeda TaxID=103827 RepID=A0A158RAT1_THECL|nr:unnamed protein product [Thelazia callipaeda]